MCRAEGTSHGYKAVFFLKGTVTGLEEDYLAYQDGHGCDAHNGLESVMELQVGFC